MVHYESFGGGKIAWPMKTVVIKCNYNNNTKTSV